ncbi:MAG: transposase [Deltaproteobacteria bacterium]|nr:transposase [Deltaproteobacteria bacterium]
MSVELEAAQKMTKDIRNAATTLSPQEVRYLVDSYYQMQDNRKRAENQVRALTKSEEPHTVVGWLGENARLLENEVKKALDKYSKSNPLGEWARSQLGIGPVIAAGLLAHIDIHKAQTAGAVWRFAGLDPSSVWAKGQKRPWNAKLKVLCWKIGESFVKVSNNDKATYARYYQERKAYEAAKNEVGDYSEQAAAGADRVGKSTDAHPWYAARFNGDDVKALRMEGLAPSDWAKKLTKLEVGEGTPMLPPGHIQSRAKRYAVKLFISHYWQVGREQLGLPVPLPYPIAHGDHVHVIEPK